MSEKLLGALLHPGSEVEKLNKIEVSDWNYYVQLVIFYRAETAGYFCITTRNQTHLMWIVDAIFYQKVEQNLE